MTPMAHLEPVACAGVTISNASLHNVDNIRKLKLRIGSTVEICRAGDTIPKVIGLAKTTEGESPEDTKNTKAVILPAYCPSCNSPTSKEGAFLRCSAARVGTFCRETAIADLVHFASRAGMIIKSLGTESAAKLVDRPLFTDAF